MTLPNDPTAPGETAAAARGALSPVEVLIIESEAGWGSRLNERLEFDFYLAAETYCRIYNRRHNPPGPAPDWYMFATPADRLPEEGMLR